MVPWHVAVFKRRVEMKTRGVAGVRQRRWRPQICPWQRAALCRKWPSAESAEFNTCCENKGAPASAAGAQPRQRRCGCAGAAGPIATPPTASRCTAAAAPRPCAGSHRQSESAFSQMSRFCPSATNKESNGRAAGCCAPDHAAPTASRCAAAIDPLPPPADRNG